MKKITLIALAFLLSSCCACRKGSPKISTLEDATWILIEFNNTPIENSPITLHFNGAEKKIIGTAPCNNFFGGYSLFDAKQNIKIQNIGATRKACPDMDLEMKFTQMLPQVTRVKIEGDHLLMIDANDELKAVLVEAKK